MPRTIGVGTGTNTQFFGGDSLANRRTTVLPQSTSGLLTTGGDGLWGN
jgi:hypothetical protein